MGSERWHTAYPQNRLGLLGYPLGHSFSATYFRDKFCQLELPDWEYLLLERKSLQHFRHEIEEDKRWLGFNVTIPHKLEIIPFLDSLDPLADKIGAVNVVKILADGSWRGFNSDYDGFRISLLNWQPASFWNGKNAIILGSGGASLAVKTVLDDLLMKAEVVSRTPSAGQLSWQQLSAEVFANSTLVVQCTPLGMEPEINAIPPLPEDAFLPGQYVIDLIYNPRQTLFLQKAAQAGAFTQNGMAMLIAQAEKAWEIWTNH